MMKRRDFLMAGAGLLAAPLLADQRSARFQYCLLQMGPDWNERARALIKLSFEVQKRCNIPIEPNYRTARLDQAATVDSPFFIASGGSPLETPSPEAARLMRSALLAGGLLLFDDTSPEGDERFFQSAIAFMGKVFPELPGPRPVPNDHAVYQSYYLLKEPRGRANKRDFMDGWALGNRTMAFFSHNDLLGAMEADPLGNWANNMEIGGGFRRELCFRLGINLTYYALTINYKKDRAFPPIIERRRRQ